MESRTECRREDTIKELTRQKMVLEKILEISADGFMIVDANGYIIGMNNAYLAFLGLKKEEVIGKYVMEVIKNSKLPEILKTGEVEVNVIHRLAEGQTPGNERVVAVSRAAVKDGDEVIGAVGQIYFRREMLEMADKLGQMDQELRYLKSELGRVARNRFALKHIVGPSASLAEVKKLAEKAAKSDFAVLITGETGAGKEVFANAIHFSSKRKSKPFIRVNCAAIPAELLESELFGYDEGAFTGARRGGKKGKFELADGGTIFLDEIGEMPPNMQAKILRVLQEGEIERIGSNRPIPIDVRVISATNQDLGKMGGNAMRADLYYRLNVIHLKVPPLRDRREDILPLVHYTLRQLNEDNLTAVTISNEVLEILQSYTWPGNVRELMNVVKRAYSLVDEDVVLPVHLPGHVLMSTKTPVSPGIKNTLLKTVAEMEREVLLNTLKSTNFNCNRTAKQLGIHRSTLYKKLDKFNIRRDCLQY